MLQKNVNKEKRKSLNIDCIELSVGAIIGKAILYDAKKYNNYDLFTRDKNRHYADSVYSIPIRWFSDKECAVEPQDKTDIFYVNVDGVDIKDQLARATTSFYNITSPDDPVTDIFAGTRSGTSRAIADGYFLFLQPLSKGEHLLEFSVEDYISGNKYAREGSYKVLVE